MAGPTIEAVSEALAPLLPGFVADGMLLHVTHADAESVVVRYSKTADACEECIMPLDSLAHVIAECLRKGGIEGPVVRVEEVSGT